MTDAGFVLAGYAIVVGGVVAYGIALHRRIATARRRAGVIDGNSPRRDELTPSSGPVSRPEVEP